MIREKLGDGSIPDQAVEVLRRRLENAFQAPGDPFTDPLTVRTLKAVLETIKEGTPSNLFGQVVEQKLRRSGSSGGGGGGGPVIVNPTVTAISPQLGRASEATDITITGTGFVDGATVTIGGVAATDVVVVNATEITAKTPTTLNAAGGGQNVVVTNPDTGAGTLLAGFDPWEATNHAVGTAPRAIATDADGNAWVANSNSDDVSKIAPDGTVSGPYAVGTVPYSIATDAGGNAWVANSGSDDVSKIAPDGTVSGPFPAGSTPYTIVVGNDGLVWVTNSGNGSVTRIVP